MRTITLIALFLATSFTAICQNIIEGTVTNFDEPLSFATISINGTTNGTVSNEKGHFNLKVSRGDTLSISYVGYVTKNLVIKNYKKLHIALESDSLDEVFITAYGNYSAKVFKTCCGITTSQCFVEDECIKNAHKKVSIKNATIYPNPSSSGNFNIEFPNSSDRLEITIHTITGQTILSRSYNTSTSKKVTIDLSSYSAGIYILNSIIDGKRLPAQKIIRA